MQINPEDLHKKLINMIKPVSSVSVQGMGVY
jgi:hypothetical protein